MDVKHFVENIVCLKSVLCGNSTSDPSVSRQVKWEMELQRLREAEDRLNPPVVAMEAKERPSPPVISVEENELNRSESCEYQACQMT